MSEKMREEFEARYPLPSTCEGFNGGFYFVTDIYSGREKRHPHNQKWLIWQASRESLVIELAPCVDAVAEALGDVYDCTRVWSAWGVGTMDQDDFHLIADDSDRVTEIVIAAIEATGLKVKP